MIGADSSHLCVVPWYSYRCLYSERCTITDLEFLRLKYPAGLTSVYLRQAGLEMNFPGMFHPDDATEDFCVCLTHTNLFFCKHELDFNYTFVCSVILVNHIIHCFLIFHFLFLMSTPIPYLRISFPEEQMVGWNAFLGENHRFSKSFIVPTGPTGRGCNPPPRSHWMALRARGST